MVNFQFLGLSLNVIVFNQYKEILSIYVIIIIINSNVCNKEELVTK